MIFKNVPVKVVENNLLAFNDIYSLHLFTHSPLAREYKSFIADLGEFKLPLGKHYLRHLELHIFGSVCSVFCYFWFCVFNYESFVVSLYK